MCLYKTNVFLQPLPTMGQMEPLREKRLLRARDLPDQIIIIKPYDRKNLPVFCAAARSVPCSGTVS